VNNTISNSDMDAEWKIIQAAQKNPAGFRPLYEKYYVSIFRFVLKRAGEENIAADISSQVFLKAMNKLPKYEYRGLPFSAWLYRIASNEVTQYFRKSSKSRVISINDATMPELVTEEYSDDTEQQRTVLKQMLSELKDDDLIMVELRFFEQRSFKEIAGILNMTESNAKVKTYRIIERMKKKARKNSE
jgi:RNA polymerase sigma-70 factor (ECF subfamily)